MRKSKNRFVFLILEMKQKICPQLIEQTTKPQTKKPTPALWFHLRHRFHVRPRCCPTQRPSEVQTVCMSLAQSSFCRHYIRKVVVAFWCCMFFLSHLVTKPQTALCDCEWLWNGGGEFFCTIGVTLKIVWDYSSDYLQKYSTTLTAVTLGHFN